MNEIIKAMEERRSIRKFKPDMPKKEDIEQIIEAGLYAASGRGKQAGLIIAVTNSDLIERLRCMNREIMGAPQTYDPFFGAPVVLIVLANREVATYVYDGSLVMGNLMLAAHKEGVGSCWIHRAKEEFETEEGKALLRSLGIEGDYEGIGHCILGYPEGDLPEARPRKENYVYYIR